MLTRHYAVLSGKTRLWKKLFSDCSKDPASGCLHEHLRHKNLRLLLGPCFPRSQTSPLRGIHGPQPLAQRQVRLVSEDAEYFTGAGKSQHALTASSGYVGVSPRYPVA